MRISHPVFKTQEQGCSEHDSIPCSSNTKISAESQNSLGWRSPSAFHKPTVPGSPWLPCKCCKWRDSHATEPSSQCSREMSAQTTVCVQTSPKRTGFSAESIHTDQCHIKAKVGRDPAGQTVSTQNWVLQGHGCCKRCQKGRGKLEGLFRVRAGV